MSLVLKDRVRETTTVLGTNDATLLGAVTGFQAFSVVGNGNTCYYTISDQSGGNWEVGIGTYSAVGPTLARTTILSSSNSGSIVSFPAGTKDVFLTYPSEKAVFLDANGNLNIEDDGELRLHDTSGTEYVALKSPGTLASSYTLTLPIDDGVSGQALITDGSGNLSWSTAASGDVYGPASATDNAVARFDLTTGKLIKNSGVTIDGSNNVSGVAQLNATTVDLTNLEVTNIKAKDGTQAVAIADSTGALTLSSGVANGVAYLNGSKVLTTGSALTWSGSQLGIGTSSPADTASIYATNYPYLRFQNSSTGTTGSDGFRIGCEGTDGVLFQNYENTPLMFYVNNSEQMRLTSTGLGIGTTSPGARLDVYAGNVRIRNGSFVLSTGTTPIGLFSTYNNIIGLGTDYTPTIFAETGLGINFSVDGSAAKAMVLNASGNLGLGVTPSAWGGGFKALDVNSTSALASNGSNAVLAQNAYWNGSTWIYKTTATAHLYGLDGSSGSHRWYTAPSGTAGNPISFTQAMTLDASGRLGVGTTSPSGIIHVNSAGAAIAYVQSTLAAGNTNVETRYISTNRTWGVGQNIIQASSVFEIADVTANATRLAIDSSGNVGIGTSSPARDFVLNRSSDANLSVVAGSSGQAQLLLGQSGQDAYGRVQYTNSTNALAFYSNNAERMRIDSSGNLLVGKTTNNNNTVGFAVNSTGVVVSTVSSDICALFDRKTTTGQIVLFRYNDGDIGNISTNGSATAYNTSSDYRLKENIQPMQNALGVVAQLNPVTYTWKADGSDGQGFIAHELQAVVPDCVTGEKDAVDAEGNPVYQGIDTSFLVATLTAAIKELKAELDATKAEVAALKAVN